MNPAAGIAWFRGMTLHQLSTRARRVRTLYAQLETRRRGRAWTRAELAQGFVGDVGDLMKLVMAKEGLRPVKNVDAALAHELADCLWSVLVLAEAYDVDLASAFDRTMTGLERKLTVRRRAKARR